MDKYFLYNDETLGRIFRTKRGMKVCLHPLIDEKFLGYLNLITGELQAERERETTIPVRRVQAYHWGMNSHDWEKFN